MEDKTKSRLKVLGVAVAVITLIGLGLAEIGYFEWVTSTYKVYAGRACYYWTFPW